VIKINKEAKQNKKNANENYFLPFPTQWLPWRKKLFFREHQKFPGLYIPCEAFEDHK